MPTSVPDRPAATILDPVDTAAVSGALPYAGPGGGERGFPMTIDSGSFAPPPVARPVEPAPQPKPAAGTAAKPVRVSDGVQAAKLIHQTQPLYPALARQVRVSGTVKIEATIGRDGAIRNLQFVSGHALLAQAAMDAVRQWRYQPTLLSGEPVEVVTQIAVHFTLQ
jgi:periplasmic protein TonB